MRKFIPLLFISFLAPIVALAAPTRVTDLRVTNQNATSVTVNWTTPAPGSGSLLENDVRMSTVPITALNWNTRTQVAGEPVPTTSGATQSAIVSGLSPAMTYHIALKVRDGTGWSIVSNVVSTTLAAYKTATVKWSAPRLDAENQGLLGYLVCQTKTVEVEDGWNCVEVDPVTSFTFGNLQWGTPDYFRVLAHYACSAWPSNPCEPEGRVKSSWSNTAIKP